MATATKGKANNQRSAGGLNRPMKTVKMLLAKCKICNPQGQGKRGWWETCPHEPYVTAREEEVRKPELVEQEDGSFVKTSEKVEIRYFKDPNWIQVADDAKVSSGKMVQIQLERGAKFPADLGYAPVCDYLNCWETNPTIHANNIIEYEGIQTRIGDYHDRSEAAIMTLRTQGLPVFVGEGGDAARRQTQLDQVQVF